MFVACVDVFWGGILFSLAWAVRCRNDILYSGQTGGILLFPACPGGMDPFFYGDSSRSLLYNFSLIKILLFFCRLFVTADKHVFFIIRLPDTQMVFATTAFSARYIVQYLQRPKDKVWQHRPDGAVGNRSVSGWPDAAALIQCPQKTWILRMYRLSGIKRSLNKRIKESNFSVNLSVTT